MALKKDLLVLGAAAAAFFLARGANKFVDLNRSLTPTQTELQVLSKPLEEIRPEDANLNWGMIESRATMLRPATAYDCSFPIALSNTRYRTFLYGGRCGNWELGSNVPQTQKFYLADLENKTLYVKSGDFRRISGYDDMLIATNRDGDSGLIDLDKKSIRFILGYKMEAVQGRLLALQGDREELCFVDSDRVLNAELMEKHKSSSGYFEGNAEADCVRTIETDAKIVGPALGRSASFLLCGADNSFDDCSLKGIHYSWDSTLNIPVLTGVGTFGYDLWLAAAVTQFFQNK